MVRRGASFAALRTYADRSCVLGETELITFFALHPPRDPAAESDRDAEPVLFIDSAGRTISWRRLKSGKRDHIAGIQGIARQRTTVLKREGEQL